MFPSVCFVKMISLKQVLCDDAQELKRLAIVVLLLVIGAIASTYLDRQFLPGAGPHFTVRAAP